MEVAVDGLAGGEVSVRWLTVLKNNRSSGEAPHRNLTAGQSIHRDRHCR
jgi:hypothetical protein